MIAVVVVTLLGMNRYVRILDYCESVQRETSGISASGKSSAHPAPADRPAAPWPAELSVSPVCYGLIACPLEKIDSSREGATAAWSWSPISSASTSSLSRSPLALALRGASRMHFTSRVRTPITTPISAHASACRPRLSLLVVLLLALSSLLSGCGIRSAAANPSATSTPTLTPTLTLTPTPLPIPHVTITEFPLPGNNIAETITVGPDGNVWFTENGPNNALLLLTVLGSALGGPASSALTQIGRITPAGTITLFPLRDADITRIFLTGITPGPDGALWFGVGGGGRIGRITTSGSISEFPIPARPTRTPGAIVAGPDGNLWFTASNVDNNIAGIWRLTPSGVFTEFPVPGAPLDIVVGPDHALWFTESSQKIGRITTGGAVTEFSLPPPDTSNSGISAIAAGPDGALWFIDTAAGKIGQITTSGAVTEFPLPTADSQPEDIAAGPDGALWFTEPLTHKIGRITTSGTITEFPLAKPDRIARRLTIGPHNTLWFTESSEHGGKIGRLSFN